MPCTNFFDLFAVGATMSVSLDKAGGSAWGAATMIEDTSSPLDCGNGEQTTGPLVLQPLADNHNEDSAESQAVLGHPDPCTDKEELGTDEMEGGLRDPFNPYDFFDVNGDRYIDLWNDILGVIARHTASGGEYNIAYDRGPSVGPNKWNMTAPDGNIDQFNDILGVISQYQHDCRPLP